MTTEIIKDKEGVPIHVGDRVKVRYREGEVDAIFLDSISEPVERADGRDVVVPVRRPPKVVFTDQRGRQVSHNPSAVVHTHLVHRQEEPSEKDKETKRIDDEDKGAKIGGDEDKETKKVDDEDKGAKACGDEDKETKSETSRPTRRPSVTEGTVEGKDGLPIHVGDTVMTPYRGGVRQGEVEAVFTNDPYQPAEQEEGHVIDVPVTHPPKVVFTTQRDKQVAHNPSALSHG